MLAIIALMSGMVLTLGSAKQESAKAEVTKDRFDTIEATLQRFAKKGGYLPCPARPSLAPTDASFAVSADCTVAAPADIATTTSSGQPIWIGMVPTRSMSLPDEYAYDGWNNRFKYAVIKDLTVVATDTIIDYDTSNNDGTGIIQIMDGSSTPHQIPGIEEYDVVGYAVVSHGKDSKGAYKKVGGSAGTCTAGSLDTENCDNDAVFVDTFVNDSTVAANYYDDYARWNLLPKLMTETALKDWTNPPTDSVSLATLSAKEFHACAIKTGGTVWCWGWNNASQLGDNTTINRNAPVQAAGVTDAIDVTTSHGDSCALKSDGAVWCWGGNHGSPPAAESITNVVQLSGIDGTAMYALKSDGSVWESSGGAWLADAGATGASQVGAGYDHFCFVKTDATVWCDGDNQYSQLGDGTTVDGLVQAIGLASMLQVDSADDSSCAIKSDGTVWCWGAMGNSSNQPPVQVSGLTGITSVKTSAYHICALKSGGTVYCLGENQYKQLGNNSTVDSGTPVVANITDVAEIAVMGNGSNTEGSTCAKKTDGTIWCWGRGTSGQLGNGASADSGIPVQVQNFP